MRTPLSKRTTPSRRGSPLASASVAYALIFGASFSLAAWGYDALVRNSNHGFWPALYLATAGPMLLGACVAAGRILQTTDHPRAWVWVWLAVGGVAGVLVTTAPFIGSTVATWLAEPALLGITIRPPLPPQQGGKALLYALLMTGGGTVLGLIGFAAVGQAPAGQGPAGRFTTRSWAHLMACVPIAVMLGLAGDGLINKPERASLVVTSRNLQDRIVDTFTLHTVHLSSLGNSAVVDVTMEDGFAMRCAVSGSMVTGCTTISSSYREWMRAIAEAASLGHGWSEALAGVRGLSVSPNALDAIAGLGESSGSYTITREHQYGDWVVMSAESNSSAVLTCYFRGHAPVVLTRCRAG